VNTMADKSFDRDSRQPCFGKSSVRQAESITCDTVERLRQKEITAASGGSAESLVQH